MPLHAQGLLEVAQAVAFALDIEDVGLVQQPIKDCGREYFVAGGCCYFCYRRPARTLIGSRISKGSRGWPFGKHTSGRIAQARTGGKKCPSLTFLDIIQPASTQSKGEHSWE